MWGVALFAQSRDPFREPEVVWGTAALAGALLVGAFVVWAVERWRKKNEAPGTNPAVELTDFRGMYERGEITEDEYAKLRDRVAKRVKVPAKPPVSPAAPDPNGPLGSPDPANPGDPPSPA